MRPSRIKAKLAENSPVLVTTLHLTDPSLHELTSLMGFDGIWLDMEHHPYSLETAGGLMRAARVGISDIIARPAKGEFMRMGRMLEAGAQGIMYPRCDDAREAAEVVKWAKFAPLGERGIDTGNPDNPYCMVPLTEYIEQANQQTFIVIQLEHAVAVEQADAIAAVPGVDVLMLGPGDFSILGGFPGQMNHDQLKLARQRIADAARNASIHWGTTCGSVEDIGELLALGANFLCYGADILMVKQGLEQIQRECEPLGFTFDNALIGGR
jgi:4-hydroxy-2-oxoheptanedioate aldolase